MKAIAKLSIEVEGKEVETLKSALNKVLEDINRIGLKHTGMSVEEGEVIKDLTDKINGE